MMRHILYLVALLQREAESSNWNLDEGREEEEDEPGDCDDGDEYEDEDDDGDGANEEYINEYDRVEIENHSNENDENCDMSDGEDELSVDSPFSLPSGLWLHLSEAIFQLSMMFWTYQEPTGDMSASAIIQYTAVLGTQGSSLAFHPTHSSSPRLAALMWVGRLLLLEYAVPVYAYNIRLQYS
ncbi:hypothetical protein ACKAV7_011942 [Fusarium commune]